MCESLIDALTFWCAGFRHVTASFGAGGFIGDHQRAFREMSVTNRPITAAATAPTPAITAYDLNICETDGQAQRENCLRKAG